MKIFIIAATIMEIEPLLGNPQLSHHEITTTGVGIPSTTYILTKILKQEKPDLVIQAGVAGTFSQEIPLGNVFVVSEDRFADLGVEENGNWLDIYDLGLRGADIKPYKNGWLKNEDASLKQYGLPLVKSITINEITTLPSRISAFRQKYQPILESMEGAALHLVCLEEQIPFLQLRAASNYIGERDKSKWQMKKAVQNLNEELARILKSLSQ